MWELATLLLSRIRSDSDHIIPFADGSLAFGVGINTKKLGIVEEYIEQREFLSLTVNVDHTITNGAPAAH